ncbi:MAG: DEAD/DEAH box helicase, partial [Patescibacteria group bacterium]
GPHIIIATPGRLNDHIEHRTVNLTTVSVLVLDEADRMLDMGFEPQIRKILATVPKERQTMLFSATMPDKIRGMARSYMKTPVSIEVAVAGTMAENITQELYFVTKDQKLNLLHKLLSSHPGKALVFSRTKHGAKKLTIKLQGMKYTSADIHSNKSLSQRKAALDGFKSGRFRVLVATDIAARGIDVNDIALVVNYDLPDNPDDYVHRIGRTGRAGKSGKAVSFAEHSQKYDVKEIERLTKKKIPLISLIS